MPISRSQLYKWLSGYSVMYSLYLINVRLVPTLCHEHSITGDIKVSARGTNGFPTLLANMFKLDTSDDDTIWIFEREIEREREIKREGDIERDILDIRGVGAGVASSILERKLLFITHYMVNTQMLLCVPLHTWMIGSGMNSQQSYKIKLFVWWMF